MGNGTWSSARWRPIRTSHHGHSRDMEDHGKRGMEQCTVAANSDQSVRRDQAAQGLRLRRRLAVPGRLDSSPASPDGPAPPVNGGLAKAS